jgi:hypothetical protein
MSEALQLDIYGAKSHSRMRRKLASVGHLIESALDVETCVH